MKTEIKEVHYCGFCKKHLFRKWAMLRHEENCTRNPKNFNQCSNCTFCQVEDLDYASDYFGTLLTVKTFKCTKKDVGIYPHAVVRKGLLKRFPNQFKDQIPMPARDCKDFEFIF